MSSNPALAQLSGGPTGTNPGPRVSFVIPAYNAAATLAQTLDAILAQQIGADEIIVVDDGSTDATPAVLARYAPRVTRIRQPNAGLASARNAGCSAATGDLIAFVDADDISQPQRLAVQIACMMSDPEIVLCYSDFSAFGAGFTKASYFRDYYSSVGAVQGDLETLLGPSRFVQTSDGHGQAALSVRICVRDLYPVLAHGNVVHPPTMMFKRSLFDATGPFDPTIRNMCDWDWIVRASRHGLFAYIDQPLLDYRLSPGQMSGATQSVQLGLDLVEVTERICARDPELVERDAKRFRAELASRCLAAADSLAERDAKAARAMIAKSFRYGTLVPEAARVLCKTLVPRAGLSVLRSARKSVRSLR